MTAVTRWKRSLQNSDGISTSNGAPNAGRVVKIAFFDRSKSLRFRRLTAKNLCQSATVIRITWRCASGGIRGVINNSGGGRNLMITVTVQLSSTRLVVRKYVDDTHDIEQPAATMCVQYYASSGIKRDSNWKCSSGWHETIFVIRTTVDQHLKWYRISRGSHGDIWASCYPRVAMLARY